MRYRTTQCPYCGYVLENRTITASELIGPPVLPCPRCHKFFRTGVEYWKDKDLEEKIVYILRNAFTAVYTIFFYSIGGAVISYMLFKSQEVAELIAILIAVIVFILMIRREFFLITLTKEKCLEEIKKEVEKAKQKNGISTGGKQYIIEIERALNRK